MIAGLRGKVAGSDHESLLIDVGGVIYRVGTSSTTISDLIGQEEPVFLHTKLVVREDNMALYGFPTTEEMVVFDLVTGVTGIGPRLGCAILSRFTPERLQMALNDEDVTLLSTVSGIGRKTAARLIVDLKGKIPELGFDGLGGGIRSSVDTEAIEALKALGYSPAEANIAIATLPKADGESVEQRIVAALRELGAG